VVSIVRQSLPLVLILGWVMSSSSCDRASPGWW
jgi:hypothetical protein